MSWRGWKRRTMVRVTRSNMGVTTQARKGEVPRYRLAAMLVRDDVVDREAEAVGGLGHLQYSQASFARVRTRRSRALSMNGQEPSPARSRESRALDCRSARRSATRTYS